jgi:hypothetical protein
VENALSRQGENALSRQGENALSRQGENALSRRDGCGCTYCAEDGSRAPYLREANSPERPGDPVALKAQVEQALAFHRRRYSADAFILYFQAYSNTNASVAELRRIYDTGLSLAPFRGLNVATRPDCVDEARADLLASYKEKVREVWIELGLQSANNATLLRVGRGHTVDDFQTAYRLLKARGLKVAVHLIFGLPGEGMMEILRTVDYVAGLGPDGVKIHNLHVPTGTVLAAEYVKGELTAPSAPRHLEYVIAALERLPPRTVIMRLTCDTPKARLVAPRHFWPKGTFTARVAAEMSARGARQGRLYEQPVA